MDILAEQTWIYDPSLELSNIESSKEDLPLIDIIPCAEQQANHSNLLGYYIVNETHYYTRGSASGIFQDLSDVKHDANSTHDKNDGCRFDTAHLEFDITIEHRNDKDFDFDNVEEFDFNEIKGQLTIKDNNTLHIDISGTYEGVRDLLINDTSLDDRYGTGFIINGSFHKGYTCGDLMGSDYGFNIEFKPAAVAA